MPVVYFSKLPLNVSRSAFRDAISKYFLDSAGSAMNEPQFVVDLELPDKPTAELKHKNGAGSVEFRDNTLLQEFLAKLKTEPIMFKSETVIFSREPPSPLLVASTQKPPARPKQEPTTTLGKPPFASAKKNPSTKPSGAPKMNLTKTRLKPQPERIGPRPGNPQYERRLQHRLSALGQRARLEKIEFGVLRDQNFSVEYSQDLLEFGGDFSFEDDQKSVRITMGGTHQNAIMPMISIAIQTINSVALGDDYGTPYMFLELLQNPHFELGDAARPSTGNDKKDAQRSRQRLSALNAIHARVAPYASRWVKMSFYKDGFHPDSELCSLAGLPTPRMNPPLTFNKRDLYSYYKVSALEKWMQSGSLPWEVAFQCEALFRNSTLVPTELLLLRPLIEQLVAESPTRACDALKSLRADIEGGGGRKTFNDFEHQDVVTAFKHHISSSGKATSLSKFQGGHSKSNFLCHHVKITPTAVLLTGPLAEQSNRVIRRYPGFESHFIRVSFSDEGDSRTRFNFEVDTNAFSEERIGKFLKNYIQIGNRQYALLGYSQSGFRDHACFFSSHFIFNDTLITPDFIRTSLGDFTKVRRCPARYGARMSQVFSSTDPSIIVPQSAIRQIPDLKNRKGDLEFSDGCGTISRELADKVWKSMVEQMPHTRRRQRHRNEPTPCAFQIRIGGSKGMVRIDPKLEGDKLCLRPSMTKFEAPGELALEIARAFERPSPCFLNRPLVMLLWTGGVDTSVFEKFMADALEATISGMQTFGGAAKQLISNRLGRPFRLASTFDKLSRLGLEPDQPGVRTIGLHKILNASLYHIKMGLKHKARIPVPDSYTLVGVCDEDNYLRPRAIYACVQHFDHASGKTDTLYLHGRMLVTRSPVIHPGDAQILYAIGNPPPGSPFCGEGNNLPNCVVFASCGFRPVPNMLGGGDLDGDLYNLIPLPELMPRHLYMPAEYPAAKLKKIARDSTIDDVADFMIEYICNDALGMIAINHLVIASSSELRARDENCMVNAELHSKAVDFVKTGYYVANHEIRRPRYDQHINPVTGMGMRPDWQAGHGRDPQDGLYYECPSVLGRLFRAVQLPRANPAREPVEAPSVPQAITNLLVKHVAVYATEIKETFNNAKSWVQALLLRYITELNHICVSHTICSESSERVSEVEVMLGTNLESASDGSSLLERMKRLTDDLASFVRSELRGEEDDNPHDWLARAWNAYLHTSKLGDEEFGAFSFSWIALSSVLEALHNLNPNFLPELGPIVPPFPHASPDDLGESINNLDQFAQVDLDNWTWDDDPKAEKVQQNDNNGSTQSSQLENRGFVSSSNGYDNSNGYYRRGRGGMVRGGRDGHSNGSGNGYGGRGRGRGQAPSRGPHNRSQSNGTQPNGNNFGRRANTSTPTGGRVFQFVQ